jgi:hypothetical protein
MKTGKFNIFLSFESMEDRDAVLEGLTKHSKLTWNNDTMQSDISTDVKKFTVTVKKGVATPPKRLRL